MAFNKTNLCVGDFFNTKQNDTLFRITYILDDSVIAVSDFGFESRFLFTDINEVFLESEVH